MISEHKNKFLFLEELNNYRDSDSYNYFHFLRENRTLVAIVMDNYREINHVLQYHDSEKIREKLWDVDPSFRFKLQKRISRHLLNYLSSIFAVVDYSRKSLEDYLSKNKNIYDLYSKKKDSFFKEDPRHRFIQGLRNYTSHYTYIKIGSELSNNVEWTKPKKSIYVLKSEILKWDKWCSKSKTFINSKEEKIRLNEILKDHFFQFISFQNWLYLQLLLVDERRTEIFIDDIQKIYDRAKAVNMSHTLAFKESYLRYINYSYKKALNTTQKNINGW